MRWKWLRVLLLGAALLVLLLAGGLWALVQGVDRGAVMARAVQEVKAATGRDFAVDGPVRLKLFPRLALVADGVRLGNAPWGSRPDMARIQQLRFDLALAPLLERRVEIGRVEVSGADLLLETNADGQGNWNFQRGTPAAADAAGTPRATSPVRVTLADLTVQGSQLTWRSGRSGQSETLDIEALRLARHPDPARSPDAWQLELDAAWHAQKLHAQGGVSVQRDEGSGKRGIPLDLDLRMDGATARIDGELGLGEAAGQAQLRVQAEVQHTKALNQVLGVALPLPVPARLRGDLAWRPRELQIDNFELESQGQTIAGRIGWDRAATPQGLQLALRAEGLDLARLYPPQRAAGGGAGSKAAEGRVFSEAPFPAIKLPRLAIKAELRAERLVLPGGLELTSVQASGSSRPDRVDVSQLAFGLARGSFKVSGQWLQPGKPEAPPRVSLQLQARGVAMDAFLALMRREAVISGGRTEVDARLSGAGHSPHRLAASLNGEVRLRMGEATSVGHRASGPGDLFEAVLHALTPLRMPDDKIRVLCAAARLPVAAGRIDIDRSIAVEGERVNVVMSGGIDLGTERIELGMRPTVKKGTGLDPSAFAGVVKIAGPLAAPQVQVNLAGTAREAVNIGAAVATSGATLIGERLLGKVTDAHPCDSAYAGSAKTSAPAADPAKKTRRFTPLRELFER